MIDIVLVLIRKIYMCVQFVHENTRLYIFLTVRGFAITKLINKKTEKSAKNVKKTSASLRDALKSLNTGNLK